MPFVGDTGFFFFKGLGKTNKGKVGAGWDFRVDERLLLS